MIIMFMLYKFQKVFPSYNIAHLEILNVVVTLKVWGHAWANKSVEIMCDNIAIVQMISFERARGHIMATCARNIWLLAAIYNIIAIVTHIRGRDNSVADLLSRWHQTSDNYQKLYEFIELPIWVDIHLDLTLLNHDI